MGVTWRIPCLLVKIGFFNCFYELDGQGELCVEEGRECAPVGVCVRELEMRMKGGRSVGLNGD